MRIRTAFIILWSVRFAVWANAANHFLHPSNTFNGDGTSYSAAASNGAAGAYNAMPATAVRGDSYYYTTGTYGSYNYNTAESGTTQIFLIAASQANHGGSVTGWDASTMAVDVAGPAFLPVYNPFFTSYWTINGTISTALWYPTLANCGFVVKTASPAADQICFLFGQTTAARAGYHIEGVGWTAPAGSFTKQMFVGYTQLTGFDSSYFGWNFVDGAQNAHVFEGTGPSTNITIEHERWTNGFSDSTHHGEQIDTDGSALTTGNTIRYIYATNNSGTGLIVANNSSLTADLYGFVVTNASGSFGNGVVTGTSVAGLVNVKLYNSTFDNVANPGSGFFSGGGGGHNTGCTMANVLVSNMSASYDGVTADYDAFYSTTNTPSETHGQVLGSSPYVNSAAGNFHLAYATNAGTVLLSPYLQDPEGTVRGGDGVLDRSAFEFQAVPPTATPRAATSARQSRGMVRHN